MIERNFKANKVAAEFLQDNQEEIQLLFGPLGCGKSSAAMIKLYFDAVKYSEPGFDGVRRTKTAIIRNTYSQLESTTVKTWKEWFPWEVFGDVKGKSPLYQVVNSSEFEWEIIFLAIESMNDIDRLKSLEVTNAYINECQFFKDEKLIREVLGRTNRFPNERLGGGLKMPRLYMDCNPPSTRHWIYQIFEPIPPDGHRILKYEPALIEVSDEYSEKCVRDRDGKKWANNPRCDYLFQQNDPDYWLRLAKGASREYILVNLCGQYGVITQGKAVHPEYNDSLHRSLSIIKANELVEIGLGFDFGLTPACAIVQLTPTAQLTVLAELWTERSDFRGFLSDIVIPFLDRKYPFWRQNYISVHDPADATGNEGKTNQMIMAEYGIVSLPAQSNAMSFRRDGLKYHLTRAPNGQPGFLLNNDIEMIREGLMGEFKYPIIKASVISGDKQYNEKPLKNMHSHICEALEYISSHYARITKESNSANTEDPYLISAGSFWSM